MPPAAEDAKTAQINARTILGSERFQDLTYRERFYLCSQHDHKLYDFNGRLIQSGTKTAMLSSEAAPWYVPLTQRRPSSPYRLAKVIVNRFTSLLFGSQRWPSIRVEGDEDTQDFCEALIESTGLAAKMIQARNIGGSVGTVGLSWCFRNGKPIVNVHNGKYLVVSEWEDRDRLIPAVVSEVFQYPKTEWDGEKRKYVKNLYWYRRDWTKEEDIGFYPIKVVPGEEPEWQRDEDQSGKHGDGFCHFVWVQNIPTEEEDGLNDYDGLYDNFDAIDMLLSVLTRGMTLNLDPTLVLKVDPDIIKRVGVKKGSDNALVIGTDGNANYLELGGQSVEAGIKLFNLKRKTCLEVAECVLTDPDEIAAGQTSAAAIAKIYEPMTARCDVLREQYGIALKRLLFQMTTSAIIHLDETVDVVTSDGSDEVIDAEGEVKTAVQYIDLPLKVTSEDEVDDMGQPTGQTTLTMEPRTPGQGGHVNLQWGPYFQPSPEDQNSLITALNMAVGGKAIMSQKTASELIAASFGRNPAEEYRRLSGDKQADTAANAAAMAQSMGPDGADAAGGKVGGDGDLPPGAAPKPKANPFAGGAPPGGPPKD